MKRLLFVMLFVSMGLICKAQLQPPVRTDKQCLKSFYGEYMTNVMEGRDNAGLCRMYMPEGLILKLGRETAVTGADAVIRAQDVSEDALRTLSVADLDNGWHMVEYRWDADRPETEVRIPVKTMSEDGTSTIAYIVPEWMPTGRYFNTIVRTALCIYDWECTETISGCC